MLQCGRMSDDLQSEMAAAARGAVEHAKKYWATELDYSPGSIEDVELILARMHESIPRNTLLKLFKKGPTEEQMANIAIAYGAYIGEVFRREFGGTWSKGEVLGQQDVLALQFTPQNMVFPPGKVWKRLHEGEEDNVWVFYQVIRKKLEDSGATAK